MVGLPKYGERASINNVNINDVITYKVKGYYIFSVVLGTTLTMIKVVDLICENTENGVNLYVNNEQNITTKHLLKPTRKIYKVVNINIF